MWEMGEKSWDFPNFLVKGLSVEVMGIRSHYLSLKLMEKYTSRSILWVTFCNFYVLLAPSWNKKNRKSAHLVAALRRGWLKECNQTWPLSVFGGWACYLLISNLETNPTAPEYYEVWIFKKAWQISCQFVREWNRS